MKSLPIPRPVPSRHALASHRQRRGAVQMEYVLIAVLIAAALLVAIVVLSRGITGTALVAVKATAADHTGAAEDHAMRQGDRQKDLEVAEQHRKIMSGLSR